MFNFFNGNDQKKRLERDALILYEKRRESNINLFADLIYKYDDLAQLSLVLNLFSSLMYDEALEKRLFLHDRTYIQKTKQTYIIAKTND